MFKGADLGIGLSDYPAQQLAKEGQGRNDYLAHCDLAI
jgi:peptidoglycan hydrolase-like amidase